jgi:hypothetical protein
MNRKVALPLGLLLAAFSVAFSVASCSGPPFGQGSTGGGGGGGGGGQTTRSLTVTLIAGTESDSTAFTVLAFSAQITGITLNQSGGSAIPLALSPSSYPVDFNRLITDTAVLGTFSISVPTGTSFASMTMAVSNITLTIANGPTAIGSCAANAVCQFLPAPSNATITATLFPGGLSNGSSTNINMYLRANEQVIVTSTSTGIAVNFTSSNNNVVGSFFLPRTSSLTTGVDLVQDFAGQVTAVSATSITVTSGTGVSLGAAINSATTLDVPQSTLCPTATIAACVTKGTFVSLDAFVASGGAITATEIDLLDNATPAVDSVEGVVFNSNGTGSFDLVVTDKQVVTGNATLTAAAIGDIFTVTLASPTFLVDTKNLTTATTPPVPTSLFAGAGDLLPGQTVRLHVTAATGSRSSNNQALTANEVQLRFTRIAGNSAPSSTSVLTLAQVNQIYGIPAGTNAQVQTYSGIPEPTQYDNGITSNANIGGLGASNSVAIRALYLRGTPNFFATMVRDQ